MCLANITRVMRSRRMSRRENLKGDIGEDGKIILNWIGR